MPRQKDKHMSEYVYCWRVQYAYKRTDFQRDTLVDSLAGVDGAVKECPAWSFADINPPPPSGWPLISIDARAATLYDALLQKALNVKNRYFKVLLPREPLLQQDANVKKDHFIKALLPPSKMLQNVIRLTYEGEKPQKNDIPKAFLGDGNKNDDFYKEYFKPLYYDSLLLRLEDVRVYCRNNQIKQFHETDGLLFEDKASVNETPPRTDKRHSLSADEKVAAAQRWTQYYVNHLRSREGLAGQIAMQKFSGKTHEKIFDIVFPNDKNTLKGTKRKRITDYKLLVQKIAGELGLPVPPGWEKK
jgi:hypothetical protein